MEEIWQLLQKEDQLQQEKLPLQEQLLQREEAQVAVEVLLKNHQRDALQRNQIKEQHPHAQVKANHLQGHLIREATSALEPQDTGKGILKMSKV